MTKLGRIRHRRFAAGVVGLQSLVRGVRARKIANKNRKVMAVRAKLAKAAARAKQNPENLLGNRTKAALDTISTAKMLTQVLKACATLEVSTRLSPPCCDAFVAAGAAGKILHLIKTCNR